MQLLKSIKIPFILNNCITKPDEWAAPIVFIYSQSQHTILSLYGNEVRIKRSHFFSMPSSWCSSQGLACHFIIALRKGSVNNTESTKKSSKVCLQQLEAILRQERSLGREEHTRCPHKELCLLAAYPLSERDSGVQWEGTHSISEHPLNSEQLLEFHRISFSHICIIHMNKSWDSL